MLLVAGGVAVAAFPFRATWWGGWILATAEAGVVGGLADWFAVTALFRRPLGLPIPHTALIPSNWEQLAARVGAMVGDRVLTREFLAHELGRVDVADLLARGAAHLSRSDLRNATRAVVRRLVHELPAGAPGELAARLRALLAEEPVTPLVAAAIDLACQHGWDRRATGALARALAQGLDHPGVRRAVDGLVDDLLARYRERMAFYPRLAIDVAETFGLIDRARIVGALRAGVEAVAADPEHPVRVRLSEAVRDLARRLERDPDLAARVERLKAALLASPVAARVGGEIAATLRQALVSDLERESPEAVEWLAERLDRARRELLASPELRADIDRWVKARAAELVDRHHGGLAGFVEKGARALGPEGAVRLVEDHAGDDLQFIRVNGTVVGALAGAGLYALHLLLGRG